MTTTTRAPGFETTPGSIVLVTGSSGLVGSRLVEMLLERGARKVLCFDVAVPDDAMRTRFKAAAGGDDDRCEILENGDLTDVASVSSACSKSVDIVYHVGALVGPFHDKERYYAVNHQGTLNVLDACQRHGVGLLVNSSSPGTRFHGTDIRGLREDELTFPAKQLVLYAETKAMAERAVTAACCDELLTISVAPHQVYGPHDSLMLPALMETAGSDLLRVFGDGNNKISVCYVDNYCHGLLCGADALDDCDSSSKVRGKFYIITDDHDVYFWRFLNEAALALGFTDLFSKFKLPTWLMMTLAYICNVVGFLINRKLKLNPYNVRMLVIDRYFNIEHAKRDLRYSPVIPHDEAWKSTIEWFKVNWLPGYLERNSKSGGDVGGSNKKKC